MFKVTEKQEVFRGEPIIKTVYGILEDSHGFPKFLFYEFGQWIYRSAKLYEPYNKQ